MNPSSFFLHTSDTILLYEKYTELTQALVNGHFQMVTDFIKENDSHFPKQMIFKNLFLFVCERNHKPAVDALIPFLTKRNTPDNVLSAVADRGHLDILQVLLPVVNHSQVPLALYRASMFNHEECVKELLPFASAHAIGEAALGASKYNQWHCFAHFLPYLTANNCKTNTMVEVVLAQKTDWIEQLYPLCDPISVLKRLYSKHKKTQDTWKFFEDYHNSRIEQKIFSEVIDQHIHTAPERRKRM